MRKRGTRRGAGVIMPTRMVRGTRSPPRRGDVLTDQARRACGKWPNRRRVTDTAGGVAVVKVAMTR